MKQKNNLVGITICLVSSPYICQMATHYNIFGNFRAACMCLYIQQGNIIVFLNKRNNWHVKPQN